MWFYLTKKWVSTRLYGVLTCADIIPHGLSTVKTFLLESAKNFGQGVGEGGGSVGRGVSVAPGKPCITRSQIDMLSV